MSSLVMVIDCPHCSAENTTFPVISKYVTNTLCWMFLQCPRCHGGVTAKGDLTKYVHSVHQIDDYRGDIASLFTRIEHFPKRPPIDVPGGLPPDIERLYLSASMSLLRDDTDGASMVIRKALEVALKARFGDISGTLCQRIDILRNQHLLTEELAQWAHAIRFDGNEGAHESEKPDLENTRQMKEFLHVFLLYTFSLPALIEKRRHSFFPSNKS